jgi:hypothetical protein
MPDQQSAPPLVSFEPRPSSAPVLRYDLPVSVAIDARGRIDLTIAQSFFKPLREAPAPTIARPGYHMVKAGRYLTNPDRPVPVDMDVLTIPQPVPIPDPGPVDVGQAVASVLSSDPAKYGALSVPRMEGAGVQVRSLTTSAGAAWASVMSVNTKASYLIKRLSMYGSPKQFAIQPEDSPVQRLFLVERYKVVSYPSDFGASRTVSTFSLLPGEKTTLTMSQTLNTTVTRDITTNVLDSYSETSSDELEKQIDKEQGTQDADSQGHESTSEADNSGSQHIDASAGGSFFGLVKGSVDGGVTHNWDSKDTGKDTSSRQRNSNTLDKALDKHVEQSSKARTYQTSTGTSEGSSVSTSTTNTTVRELQNINFSRVLNFVVRQISQEYISINYLDDVSVVYYDGTIDGLKSSKIELLDEFLDLYILPQHLQEVKAQIINTLCRVEDWKGDLVPFLERAPRPTAALPEPGWPPPSDENFTRYRKNRKLSLDRRDHGFEQRISLGKTNSGEARPPVPIDGIILSVTSRMLQTNNVVVDALLGQGDALDEYNVQLQAAAVDKAHLANAEEQLAVSTVEGVVDPGKRVDAYGSIFNPPKEIVSDEAGT